MLTCFRSCKILTMDVEISDEHEIIDQLRLNTGQSSPEEETQVSFAKIRTWPEIITRLETITSETELREWLRSPLFRPQWIHYYSNFLLPHQIAGGSARGDELKSVIKAAAAADREAERLYTRQDPDTSNWTATDWITQMFVQVYNDNEVDRNGIFYAKHWSRGYKENLLWRIIIKVKLEHAPTRAVRSGGGYDLMAITPEQRSVFQNLCVDGPRRRSSCLIDPITSNEDQTAEITREASSGYPQEPTEPFTLPSGWQPIHAQPAIAEAASAEVHPAPVPFLPEGTDVAGSISQSVPSAPGGLPNTPSKSSRRNLAAHKAIMSKDKRPAPSSPVEQSPRKARRLRSVACAISSSGSSST
jgi:hypothetical protein